MKAIMALSGGMDSATVLAYLLYEQYSVICVNFHYESKHNQWERRASLALIGHYLKNIPNITIYYKTIDLSQVFSSFKSNLLLSGGDIPEGHYTHESMSKTVVPGRNIIFLSVLAGLAWSEEAQEIAIGIHQGDHAIYADCRETFYEAMNQAIQLGTDNNVRIVAPFVNTDKTGILKWGLEHNVPYCYTRTCYKNQELSCGKCGSCVERLEAFNNLGIADPIQYEVKV
jgi:7-cyano-7-deazaguanine synthase